MPRRPKPFFDADRNAWRLRKKVVLPNGKIKRHHHLCSGRENYAQALDKAAKLMGGILPKGDFETLGEAITEWLVTHGGPWERWVLQELSNWAGGVALRQIKPDFLEKYARHLQRLKRPRDRKSVV